MHLQTKQILAFRDKTSFMRQNTLLPVLEYILLKDGHLVKTNMQAWAKMPIDGIGDTQLLFDEKMLYNFASRISTDTFEVTVKGNQVYLAADITSRFQTDDVTNYPKMPEEDSEVTPVEIINTVPYRQALAYTAKSESIPTFRGYVHHVNNLIWAGDGNGFYSYKQQGPELTLSADAVQAITQFDTAVWYKAGNYDFFKCGAILYGFIKPELKGPDITQHLPDRNPSASASTLINRQKLISFCEMCITSTPKNWCEVKMSTGLSQIVFDMADDDYNKGNNLTLPCDVTMPDFSFNAVILVSMLKALPYETLTIYRDHVQLTIRSEDENFQAMLQGLVPVV